MVVRKRKKYAKYLGKRYARRGYNDRNRGGGSRGGRGMSGWRFAKHKYHKILKEHPELFKDKKGFTLIKQKEIKILNLHDIESNLNDWINAGLIYKEGDKYVIDLYELGYDKLLGKGSISVPVKIIASSISDIAKRKVEEAGGEVIIKSV